MELSAIFEGVRLSLGLRLAAAVLPRGTFDEIVKASDPIAFAKKKERSRRLMGEDSNAHFQVEW